MTIQRFLSNHRTIISGSNITMPVGSPEGSRSILPVSQRKSGTGSVEVVGGFTDLSDDTLEVQISTDPDNINEELSEAEFNGQGNGDLQNALIAGELQPNQQYTIRMVDEGTEDTKASTPAFGATVRAKTTGVGGNNLTISVDRGPLRIIRTPSNSSTILALQEGTTNLGGQEIDLGGPFILDGKLPIPESTPPVRISFKGHPFVYWAYRETIEGTVRNLITPALKSNIPINTVIENITGLYAVNLTDGVVTEQHLAITEYDLLSSFERDSSLVEVDGIVVQDMTPGSQGTNEINIYTSPYPSDVNTFGSEFVTGFEDGPNVELTAPTENVTVECIDNSTVGGELWRVTAPLSDELANAPDTFFIAETAVKFTHPSGVSFDFIIPVKTADTLLPEEERFRLVEVVYNVGARETLPKICVDTIQLGARATSKRIVFTYEKRPVPGCECIDVEVQGSIDPDCYGLPIGPVGSITAFNQAYINANSSETTEDGLIFDRFLWVVTENPSILNFGVVILITMSRMSKYINNEPGFPSPPFGSNIFPNPFRVQHLINQTQEDEMVLGLSGWEFYAIENKDFIGPITTLVFEGAIPVTFLDECNTLFKDTFIAVDFSGPATSQLNDLVLIYQADITALAAQGLTGPDINLQTLRVKESVLDALKDKYREAIEAILILAGLPPADPVSDGCWVDIENEQFHWVPDDGNQPAFTNYVYMSSRQDVTGAILSTEEYSLSIACGCVNQLEEGDRVIVEITPEGLIRTYQVGDSLRFTTIKAASLPFQGGITGTNELTWTVVGDLDGNFPDYLLNVNEDPYSESGLSFAISRGVIPYRVGDTFKITTEALLWRYAFGDGVFSALMPLDFNQTVLGSSGLSLLFQKGQAPSFVGGDFLSFALEQTNAPNHLLQPDPQIFRWEGSAATIKFVLSGSQDLDAIALGFVDLPSGASVLIEGSNDGGSTFGVFSEALTVQNVAMTHFFSSTQTVDALQIVIISAPEGELGWFWAGETFSPGITAQVNLRRQVQMSNPVAGTLSRRFTARSFGGDLEYDNFLNNDSVETGGDAVEIETMFDYSKTNGNWPFIFAPNTALPDRVLLGSFTQDELALNDLFWFQSAESGQAIALTFGIEGVISA